MASYHNEDAVVDDIYRALLPFAADQGLALEAKCHVFLGVTAGRKRGRLRWLCQSAQQDLVFYSEKDSAQPLPLEENELLRRFHGSFADSRVLFPLLIFEVKYKGVITHTLRQYSEEARLIRWAHPFCRYNLLLVGIPGKRPDVDKVYMAAKSFHAVLGYPQWPEDRERLLEDVKRLVLEHLRLLRNDPFYRLADMV